MSIFLNPHTSEPYKTFGHTIDSKSLVYLNVVKRLTFPLENIIILVLLVLTISLNSVQYSCTEFKALCKSRSFSANISVSSAYSNTNNFKNNASSLSSDG